MLFAENRIPLFRSMLSPGAPDRGQNYACPEAAFRKIKLISV